MNELGLTYLKLKREVGRFLGFDRDPSNWGSNEIQDVEDVIDSGLRQFYFPPRLPEERWAHRWSFLRPLGHVNVISGQWDYDLPEDFSSLDGDLFFQNSDTLYEKVQLVNEPRILQLRQDDWFETSTFEPKYAAITPNRADGISTTTYQLMLWPRPDKNYLLTFKYFVRPSPLRSDGDVPLGGPEHSEAIRASCMAAAEAHLDDEIGPKWERFLQQLRGAIDFDRKANSPSNLGVNDDRSVCSVEFRGQFRAIGGLVTLEKFPPDGGTDPGEGEGPGTVVITQDGQVLVDQNGNPITPQG